MELLAGKNLPSLKYVISNNLQANYNQQIYGMHILLHLSTIWVPFIFSIEISHAQKCVFIQ